jgi:hypothetical protein
MILFFVMLATVLAFKQIQVSEYLRELRNKALHRAEKQPTLTDELAILNSRFASVAARLAEADLMNLCREHCEKEGMRYNAKLDECEETTCD